MYNEVTVKIPQLNGDGNEVVYNNDGDEMLLDDYLILNVSGSNLEINSSQDANESDLESDDGQDDVSETVVFDDVRVQVIELLEGDSDDDIDFFD